MNTLKTPPAATPERRQWLAGAAATLAGWPLNPLVAQGSQAWPEVRTALPDAHLVGSTKLRVWGFEVYAAQLWVASGFRASRFGQFMLALSLSYLRDLKGVAIAERSLKEMQDIEPIPEAQAELWRRVMRQIFPDVRAGDRLTGLHRPGVGASFWLNGQALGDVADADFSQRFFGIWLADATSEPGMRRALLAGATP